MISAIPADAQGQAGTAQIVGSIVDQANNLPIVNATVQLINGDAVTATGKTDSNGQVIFKNVAAGIYHLGFSAPGYELGQTDDLVAINGQTTSVRTVLVSTTANTTGSALRQIASVTSRRAALQTSSVITQHIAAEKIQQEGLLRVGDAVLSLPGISANDLDSAPGDDLHLNIRGLRGSETATLLDGHPIGPIGIFAGNRGGYNWQLSPSFGLNNVQVAYGSGGLALYGTDTVAGAIDMQTLEPTRLPQFSFTQGFGTQARTSTSLVGTGSSGRWGYAFAAGVQGTQGGFKPAVVQQSGNLTGDLSPANVAANTWVEAGNYLLRTGLAKLRYEVSPGTNLTFTAYDATSWDDKTGNGDNDYLTPQYVGASFDNLSADPACPAAQQSVVVSNGGATQCFTRSQWVNAFSGPAGGSPVAWQTLHNQDYGLRLSSRHGNNAVNASLWMDNFQVYYDRNSRGPGLDNGHTNTYNSFGEEISDDIISANNDFGFGVYGFGQTELDTVFNKGALTTNPTISESSFNYFIRDEFQPTSRLSFFGTAWVKEDSVTKATYFDPRLTMLFRPTSRDVVRLSAGKANGSPNIGLLYGGTNFNSSPASLVGNINCGASGVTSVGSTSNPNVGAERMSDEEISVGHQFSGDTNIQLIAYDMNESNVIYSAVVPLSALGLTPPAGLTFGPGGYLSVIGTQCGTSPTVANLGATTNANAGAGRYRGFDITGRLRASRQLYFDYSYDVLSARNFNIPAPTQQNNVNIIDGGQVDKVPVHQAALGFDYSSGGWETRFDGYYVGLNNGLLRPAYTYANASISKRVSNLTFNLGIYNVFNSQYDQFGRIGYGTFQPENSYGTDSNVLQAALNGADGEQFGLPQRSFLFSITTHF